MVTLLIMGIVTAILTTLGLVGAYALGALLITTAMLGVWPGHDPPGVDRSFPRNEHDHGSDSTTPGAEDAGCAEREKPTETSKAPSPEGKRLDLNIRCGA